MHGPKLLGLVNDCLDGAKSSMVLPRGRNLSTDYRIVQARQRFLEGAVTGLRSTSRYGVYGCVHLSIHAGVGSPTGDCADGILTQKCRSRSNGS
ncbi:hypothetical protein AXFE_16020 [Acidithrix ferrooxidans]|uniref:Uncharacterized protein n=1 Tax=Acidithrix ferrooxidans TaxID=1280514 RepID=A0A0D8HIE5_9ACTN|nr:hypothetical protein AXFE_16020 [Acidithrix ferrooxidans]